MLFHANDNYSVIPAADMEQPSLGSRIPSDGLLAMRKQARAEATGTATAPAFYASSESLGNSSGTFGRQSILQEKRRYTNRARRSSVEGRKPAAVINLSSNDRENLSRPSEEWLIEKQNQRNSGSRPERERQSGSMTDSTIHSSSESLHDSSDSFGRRQTVLDEKHYYVNRARRSDGSRHKAGAQVVEQDATPVETQRRPSDGLMSEKRNLGEYKERRKRERMQRREGRSSDSQEDQDSDRWVSDIVPGAVWERGPRNNTMRILGSNLLALSSSTIGGAPPVMSRAASNDLSMADHRNSVMVTRAEVVDEQAIEERIRASVRQEVVQADILDHKVRPYWKQPKFLCLLVLLVAIVIVAIVVGVLGLGNPSPSNVLPDIPTPTFAPTVSIVPSKRPSQSPTNLPTTMPTVSIVPSSTPTASPTTTLPCVSSLTAIAQAEQQADVSVRRKYTLCGFRSYALDVFLNGTVGNTTDDFGNLAFHHPIILRPNVTIQCGNDGGSHNNCVLFGGDYGVIAAGSFFGFEVLENVVVKGMKFFNSRSHNILLSQPGNVTFVDCTFSVRACLLGCLLDLSDELCRTRRRRPRF